MWQVTWVWNGTKFAQRANLKSIASLLDAKWVEKFWFLQIEPGNAARSLMRVGLTSFVSPEQTLNNSGGADREWASWCAGADLRFGARASYELLLQWIRHYLAVQGDILLRTAYWQPTKWGERESQYVHNARAPPWISKSDPFCEWNETHGRRNTLFLELKLFIFRRHADFQLRSLGREWLFAIFPSQRMIKWIIQGWPVKDHADLFNIWERSHE